MSRMRSAVVLALCALFAAALAGLAVADPFHLRHARWFTAGLVLLALLLGTAAFALVVRGRMLRVFVLAVGGIAALGWVAAVVAADRVTVENREVSEAVDGGRRLVVVEGHPPTAGPSYAVLVRAGSGVFEQETVVYQGVRGGPPPTGVRFVDTDTVEVRTKGGCVYRSEVEPGTLAVDPVHRPLHATAC